MKTKKKKLDIIYEDKDIIIVNKDAHLLTISNDKEKENTLYHQVSLYLKKQNKNNKVFIIHRLDRETSGLVILAKSLKVKKIMQDNWQDVIRLYKAVLKGNINNEGILKSYLKETKTHYVYSSKGGKEAITEYKKLDGNKSYSLVEIKILTGRKHQIRVQFNDIGYPIVGDTVYSKQKGSDRLYLHAYYLEFKHPVSGKIMQVSKECPDSFYKFIH